MRKLLFVASLIFICGTSDTKAQCFGSDSFQTCTDDSGNSYTVNRFGNTTIMNGYSAGGGSWSQNSHSFGDTTIHSGTASDGGSWSLTDQRFGSSRSIFGTDSDGNTVSRFCGPYGCD